MSSAHDEHHEGHGAGHGHVHHLSPAPIVVAIGALGLYLGFVYLDQTPIVLGVGTLAFLFGIWLWIREDFGMWRDKYVDHGVAPGGRDLGWWGMMFFLGTEITLFGGLFGSFFVIRDDVPGVWVMAREHLAHAIPLVTVNTVILVSSGATMHWALHAIRKDDRKKFLLGLGLTLLLGTIFLAVQVREYASLIDAGILLNAGELGQFGSVFYLLTGTHGFHVFLGLVFIGILFVRGWKGQFDAKRHVAVDAFAIYWHFVDIVWIGLYFVVYLGVI